MFLSAIGPEPRPYQFNFNKRRGESTTSTAVQPFDHVNTYTITTNPVISGNLLWNINYIFNGKKYLIETNNNVIAILPMELICITLPRTHHISLHFTYTRFFKNLIFIGKQRMPSYTLQYVFSNDTHDNVLHPLPNN